MIAAFQDLLRPSYLVLFLLVVFFSINAPAQKPPIVKAVPKPSIFDREMIKNGGAETGDRSGWTGNGDLKTIVYGEFGGGPDPGSPGPPNRGDKYFYCDTTKAVPSLEFTQKVDLTSGTAEIDAGIASYSISGWFGVANGSNSIAGLRVSFLDKTGKEIAKAETPEIKESDRPADQVLLGRAYSGKIPAGTRGALVTLEFHIFAARRDEDLDNLAFADNLSLVIDKN